MIATTGWLLAVGSALAWSGFDVTRKLLTRHLEPLALLGLLTAGHVPVFLLWAALEPELRLEPDYFAPAVASAALNVLANVLFLRAVELSHLSRTIPMLSLTPVLTTLAAFPLLGEWPDGRQLVGIAFVVGGAWTLSRPPREKRGRQPAGSDRGVWMMCGVAALWATTAPLDKLALQHASVGVHGLLLSVGVGVGAWTLLVLRGGLPRMRRAHGYARPYLAAVLFAVIALGLQFIALGYMMVSQVESVKRAVGISAAVIAGRLAFGEPITVRKLVTLGMMIVGVSMVLL